MLDIAARRADFRALHNEGYFLLPTAWDVSGAKRLEVLGFAGLASSNTSLAWLLGREDGHVTRDEVLKHLRVLVNATELPVNADFGSGFAAKTAELMTNVRLAIDTGVEALTITDAIGNELYSPRHAIARIQASRDAIAASGVEVLLVGRSEGLAIGRAGLNETIGRLVAYADGGADVLCAPGLSQPNAIRTVVEAVAPKAVDVALAKPGMTAVELGNLGVRRISVDDSIAAATRASFERFTQRFIEFGDLTLDGSPAA
jgi:2-methylisocitrate lyase-like PEP mutase family enzyme